VSSGEEVEDAGLGRVGKEEATGSLEIGGLCVADGPIEVEKGSRIAALALTAGLYIIRAGERGFTDLDVDIVDTVLNSEQE
jgi:hypothetical protein